MAAAYLVTAANQRAGDPVFRLLPEVRKIDYATNVIESLHSQVRKAIGDTRSGTDNGA